MAALERQTAQMSTIAALLSGTFVKAEAQLQPSYIQTTGGKMVSRVHLIAVVVSLSDPLIQKISSEVTLDDGTGKIVARSFEDPSFFTGVELGDILRIIGKVRIYHEQLYLIPELMKKISNKHWVTLHKLQLQTLEKQQKMFQQRTSLLEITEPHRHEEIISEEIPIDAEEEEAVPLSPLEELMNLIKTLDEGNGAPMELILQKAGTENEKLLHHLLEAGEIFEIAPGRIKVLD